MADDLTALSPEELEARAAEVRARMRPLEQHLAALRGERDVLLTELRRRDRQTRRERRASLKELMRAGDLPTFAQLVAAAETGALEDYRYHLKTGGEVSLGFPGAKPAVAFTDGRQVVQARDLAQVGELYTAGWEMGTPGRPGLRVHFPGTRQEKLVDPDDVFVRPLDGERETDV